VAAARRKTFLAAAHISSSDHFFPSLQDCCGISALFQNLNTTLA